MLLSYALGGAAVRVYCYGRSMRSVELLCMPDFDVAIVYAR